MASKKLEVRRMDGEWYVFGADGQRYTFAEDEAAAHKSAAADLLIEELERLSREFGRCQCYLTWAMKDFMPCRGCTVRAALTAAQVPVPEQEGRDGRN